MLDLPKKRVALSLLAAAVFFSIFPFEDSLSSGLAKQSLCRQEGEALVKIEKMRCMLYLEKDDQ